MNNPYGQCQHTKYDGSEPCIHDAYQRGREDAAQAVREAHYTSYDLNDCIGVAMAAARGDEQE